MPLFSVRLTPTKEELLDGMKRAGLRRAGNTRLIVQTLVLIAVAVWSFVAFFGGGMKESMSLVIGMAAVVLIPVMWFVPLWQMKSMAEELVSSGTHPKLWVFEDGLDFGEEQPDYAYYPFGSFLTFFPRTADDCQTLVLRFQNDDVIVIPKALLDDEQWGTLVEKVR